VVERQSRPVTIHSFELRRDEGNKRDVHFRVSCSKGTYIRSLAHDLVSKQAAHRSLKFYPAVAYFILTCLPLLEAFGP
jgi:tRNA U55 pseudouridine synthase TruB